MSELLEKQEATRQKIAATDKESKPLFHISAPAGWINDPNGFSVYNGKFTCFISTIHICVSGDLCIGGIVRQAI